MSYVHLLAFRQHDGVQLADEKHRVIGAIVSNPLMRKLDHLGLHSPELQNAVAQICLLRRFVAGRSDICSEGAKAGGVTVLLKGVACRYKLTPNGKRQILSFLLPGDFCNLAAMLQMPLDHGVGALTQCSVGTIAVDALTALSEAHRGVRDALGRDGLIDVAISREWIVNIGRRTARERMAHLFCEIACRLEAGGQKKDALIFDVTQIELGDALGLSVVHVNRTLQQLRREELIQFDSHKMILMHGGKLAEIGGFNADYLNGVPSMTRGGEEKGKRKSERADESRARP